MPDVTIDEVNDLGIILDDGTHLSWCKLSAIMSELANENLLKQIHLLPTEGRSRVQPIHVVASFGSSAKYFEMMGEAGAKK